MSGCLKVAKDVPEISEGKIKFQLDFFKPKLKVDSFNLLAVSLPTCNSRVITDNSQPVSYTHLTLPTKRIV